MLIKDGTVHQLIIDTTSIVSLDSFIRALTAETAMASPLLPDGCISFVGRQNGSQEFWIMRPPTIWSVGFHGSRSDTPHNNGALFSVYVPWTLYKVTVLAGIPNRVNMFMMKERPTSADAQIYRSYLPNQDDAGYCCLHTDLLVDCNNRDVSLVIRINRLIGRIAASNFNDDLNGWRTGRLQSISNIPAAQLTADIAPGNTDAGVWCRRLAVWTTGLMAAGTPLHEIARELDLVPLGSLNSLLNLQQDVQ